MKFVLAVVMLALALGAQSSVVPLAHLGGPLSYTAVSGPALLHAAPLSVAHHVPAAVDISHHSAWLSPAVVHAAPLAVAHHATPWVAPAVVAHPLAVEGSYVAKTRGAVHVAPLSGHANSAASINLEPAPGTV